MSCFPASSSLPSSSTHHEIHSRHHPQHHVRGPSSPSPLSNTSVLPLDPRLPCLLFPRNFDEPSLTFYNLSGDCFYRLPIPIILGSECLLAIHGYLLLESRFMSKLANHS
ncbi:hypothetical protein QJS04_geneDACA018161 [Acorus gramineus]|uniref:Uncharacterized protein n=1 Tax=Acorus gramineus TaxID=55184 RepID=A0AAV9AM77_ACOGR|nr:hypothetical protein QJS04_geneDACA018161 [Acorus gramineus]